MNSREPGRMTAGERPVSEWLESLAAMDWDGKREGAEYSGPCPVCGGQDRFHVRPGRQAGTLAHCRRGCSFSHLARAVFGAPEAAPLRPLRPWWERRRKPRHPADALAWTADLKRIPSDVEHPARRWAAWKTGAPWTLDAAPLRFRVASGGVDLVAPLMTPERWDAGNVGPPWRAVQVLHLTFDGRPRLVRDRTQDGSDKGDRTSHGLTAGRLFLARPGKPSEVLHVVEGLAHSLVVGAWTGEDVAAAFGSLRRLPGLARQLGRRWKRFRAWADGDEPGRDGAEALRLALHRVGRPVAIERLPDGQDADDVLRDKLAEEHRYRTAERAAMQHETEDAQ